MVDRNKEKAITRSPLACILDIIQFPKPSAVTDKSVLHQKFIVEGLSSAHVAKELGCSKTTVKKYLRQYNIRKNTPNGKSKFNLALGEKDGQG